MAMLRAVAWILLATIAAGYIVEVRANGEECFLETVRRGDKVLGSFSVAAGGNLDIDLKIFDAKKRILFQSLGNTDDSFAFVADQDGRYTVCLSNSMSSLTSKTVSFKIFVGTSLVDHEIAKKEHLDPLENSVLVLGESLQTVVNEQQYLVTRDRLSRGTNESTNSRVLWWSILETAVLLAVGAWQVRTVRRYLDRRSGGGMARFR